MSKQANGAGARSAIAVVPSEEMTVIRMPLGKFWGTPITVQGDSEVLLTLCRYEADSEFPTHAHDGAGLFILLKGDHCEETSSGSVTQQALTGIWHDRGFAHATRIGPRGMTGLNMTFTGEAPSVENRISFGPEVTYAAAKLFSAIRSAKTTEIENRSWELLANTIEAAKPEGKWLDKVFELVRSDPATARLSTLAQRAAVHPVYLARCYRNRFGKSISQHSQEFRLGNALRLILDGMPVGEAAHEAGFSDHAHLSRLCKSLIGHSPRDFAVRFQSFKP